MMAMLFAINIVKGTWTYAKVPAYFKPATKEHLIAMGAEDLAVE